MTNEELKEGLVELKFQLLNSMITNLINSDIPINPNDAMDIIRYIDRQIGDDREFAATGEKQLELLKAFE